MDDELRTKMIAMIEEHVPGTVVWREGRPIIHGHPSRWTAWVVDADDEPVHRCAGSMLCPDRDSALVSLMHNLRIHPDSPLPMERRLSLTQRYVSAVWGLPS